MQVKVVTLSGSGIVATMIGAASLPRVQPTDSLSSLALARRSAPATHTVAPASDDSSPDSPVDGDGDAHHRHYKCLVGGAASFPRLPRVGMLVSRALTQGAQADGDRRRHRARRVSGDASSARWSHPSAASDSSCGSTRRSLVPIAVSIVRSDMLTRYAVVFGMTRTSRISRVMGEVMLRANTSMMALCS